MRPCSCGRWASDTTRVAGGEASIMTNHLAVAAVVATETAVAETAMAAAGWAVGDDGGRGGDSSRREVDGLSLIHI